MFGLCRAFYSLIVLPPVMHPEIVSGIGIATNHPFGTETALFSVNMVQFLLEQPIK